MALKILLVDSDRAWLAMTKKYFLDKTYEVSHVENGKDAQLAIYNNSFFAVIINHDIQNYSLMQVLKFVKNNSPSLHLVVITDEQCKAGEFVPEKELKKIGVKDVVAKSLGQDELRKALEGHQSLNEIMGNLKKRDGASPEVDIEEVDSKFTRVRIDSFFSGKNVLFDIFIKLGDNKYIKILHTGDSFDKERIDKYKNEKKVEYLYFLTVDRRKYLQYTTHITDKFVENKNISTNAKLKMVQNTAEKYVEDLFAEGIKPQVIDQGKEICKTVYKMIEGEDGLHKLLRDYQDFDPSAYSHAYLVTLFSGSIISRFEWQSKATIETTSLACLFHDIGKLQLPEALLTKDPLDMTDLELDVYKTHSELGAKLVDGNRLISNSVKQIILQHHEAYNGTGFPYGLKGSKILTLANIVCLADDFVRLVMRNSIKPVEALKKILQDKEGVKRYNSMIMENFIQVFVDPSKIKKEQVALPSNSRVVNTKKHIA